MSSTEAAICYLLLRAAPKSVSKTTMLKLAYFADLESTRRFGEPITAASWKRDNFGAVAYEIPNTARSIPGVQVSDYRTYSGNRGTDFCAGEGLEELAFQLSPSQRAILDEVFDTLGGMMAKELGAKTKQTEPWLAAEAQGISRLDLNVVAPGPGDRFSHFAHILESVDLSVRGSADEIRAIEDATERFMTPFRTEAISHG